MSAGFIPVASTPIKVVVRGPSDDLIFPSSASRKANTNDFALNTNFNSLTFSVVNYVINGTAGNGISIVLANGISIDVGSVGPITFNPNIFLGANQTWTSGFGTLTLNGNNAPGAPSTRTFAGKSIIYTPRDS